MRQILLKLELPETRVQDRRVLAVLKFLRG